MSLQKVCIYIRYNSSICSSQFTEDVSPRGDRSTRGVTGLRELTSQLAEPTHSVNWPVTSLRDTADRRENREK